MDSLKIIRIIPSSYKRQLVLINYLVGEAEPKNASKIIKAMLDEKSNEKTFLKRIRKKTQSNNVEVIICEEDHKERQVKLQAVRQLIISTKIMALPKYPPLTLVQYQQWSKIWPVNFIRQQITRQIPHSFEEIKFLTKIQERQTNPFDFCFFKGEDILLTKSGMCSSGTIRHPVMEMLEQWPNSEHFLEKPEQWYYLTGIKMYCRNSQLCGMCSMALVHSRLTSIYLQKQPSKTMDSIMGCTQLNHQITMFLIN